MGTTLSVETVELECDLAEAIPPGLGDSDSWRVSYPYPELRATAERAVLEFESITLANEWLEVRIVPQLGGRIVEILDKRTGSRVLPFPQLLELKPGGPRGCWAAAGVQIGAGLMRRSNGMGPVEFQLQHAADSSSLAGVILHELILGLGVSWHATWSVAPDAARIEIDFRCLNRGFEEVPFVSGLSFGFDRGAAHALDSNVLSIGGEDAGSGLAVCWEQGTFDLAISNESLDLQRGLDGDRLLPRTTDSWRAILVPWSGAQGVDAAGACGSISVTDSQIRVQAAVSLRGCRIVALGAEGRTLEAPCDLRPDAPFVAAIAELGGTPRALSLRDPVGNELLRWDEEATRAAVRGPIRLSSWSGSEPQSGREGIGSSVLDTENLEGSDSRFRLASRRPGYRGASATALGLTKMRAGRFEDAAAAFDEALGFAADDHLLWWLKAAALRKTGTDTSDQPELPNAHYLAPLEPVLRAEAFLRQPIAPGMEPSSLLKPFGSNPDAMIEVACLLIQAGLVEDAARWVDECLRMLDEPVLRYLIAAILLRRTTMEVEAARHVLAAVEKPLGPPYPWRRIERECLGTLAGRFPGDPRIRSLILLMDGAPERGT